MWIDNLALARGCQSARRASRTAPGPPTCRGAVSLRC